MKKISQSYHDRLKKSCPVCFRDGDCPRQTWIKEAIKKEKESEKDFETKPIEIDRRN